MSRELGVRLICFIGKGAALLLGVVPVGLTLHPG